MRLWRGLSKRILVASIACGLLGLLSARFLATLATRDVLLRNTIPVWIDSWESHGRARCMEAPESWTQSVIEGARAWAYDADTLRSHNPAAPPLDPDLLAEIPEGGDRAVILRGLVRGGSGIYRSPRGGACGIVVTTWTARVSMRNALEVLLSMAVLAAALAAAFGVVAVVRPLTLRIDRLKRAAEHVGDPEGYVVAESRPADDELGELSSSLDRAHARIRDDAKRLEQRQADLLRHLDDVTHDLRTPLASLLLALEQAVDATADAERRELLHGALKDVVYLGGLTANLRLASQLREGWSPTAKAATVDLATAVARVAARAQIVARRFGIALEVAVPDSAVQVTCDPVAVEQAIGNVVDNAVAYGDPGGHVAVVLEAGGGRFSLRVEDDGPGVRESELPRLGERTFRSDEARQRDPRGSGLGLAITGEVCERCGWSLVFDRGATRGLCVTIAGSHGILSS
jgi:signal transduction histidine kinase